MNKSLNWTAEGAVRPLSAALLYLAAGALQAASRLLTRMAVDLTAEKAAHAPSPGVVEFHAFHRDGAAPEGALYVDGKLVGTIAGVTRL